MAGYSDINADLKCARRVARRVLCLMFLFALLAPDRASLESVCTRRVCLMRARLLCLSNSRIGYSDVSTQTTTSCPAHSTFMRRT